MHKRPDPRSWWGDVDHDDDLDEPSTLVIADVAAILADLATMTPAEIEAEFAYIWGDE